MDAVSLVGRNGAESYAVRWVVALAGTA